MSEPQDHRRDLPWKVETDQHEPGRPGSIWTEPPIAGAAPLLVVQMLHPSALASYITELHNAALVYRSHLPDLTLSADEYMATHYASKTPQDTVGLERVRDAYADGYGDGWRASTAIGQQEARDQGARMRSLMDQVEAAEKRSADLVRQLQDAQAVMRTNAKDRDFYRDQADQGAQETARQRGVIARQSEALNELEDIADDARVLASHSSSPGAREAAAERLRARSPAIQDHAEQFEQEIDLAKSFRLTLDPGEVLHGNPDPTVWARQFMLRFRDTQADEGIMRQWFAQAIKTGTLNARKEGWSVDMDQVFLPAMSVNRGGIQFPPARPEVAASVDTEDVPDAYDKAIVLRGVGHHSPSYHNGYRVGREDVSNAFREPMEDRDGLLYQALLLISSSVSAYTSTARQYQKTARTWSDRVAGLLDHRDVMDRMDDGDPYPGAPDKAQGFE